MKDYQEQVKQMLKDLAKEKEKDAEKPLPHMNQVPRTAYDPGASETGGTVEGGALDHAAPCT